MLQKTRGIVLHVLSYREASVIAHVYTESLGMQSFLLNGVRKPKARFNANLMQPLSCIELVAYIKPGNSLHRVSDISSSPSFSSIPYDTVKTTMALFLAEVMYRSIREEEKNQPLFDFIYNSVLYLDQLNEHFHLFHLLFMVKLCRFLGFYPRNSKVNSAFFDMREGVFTDSLPLHADILDSETGKNLKTLLDYNLDTLSECELNAVQRRNLLRGLVTYYELHQMNGHRMQSLNVLEEVMTV